VGQQVVAFAFKRSLSVKYICSLFRFMPFHLFGTSKYYDASTTTTTTTRQRCYFDSKMISYIYIYIYCHYHIYYNHWLGLNKNYDPRRVTVLSYLFSPYNYYFVSFWFLSHVALLIFYPASRPRRYQEKKETKNK
jgi:hypothetical protein